MFSFRRQRGLGRTLFPLYLRRGNYIQSFLGPKSGLENFTFVRKDSGFI